MPPSGSGMASTLARWNRQLLLIGQSAPGHRQGRLAGVHTVQGPRALGDEARPATAAAAGVEPDGIGWQIGPGKMWK